MKYFTVTNVDAFFIVTLVSILFARARGQFSPQDLVEKWTIEAPLVTFDPATETFVMDYSLHPGISVPDNLRFDMLSRDCHTPAVSDGIPLDTITTGGQHVFRVEPQILATNPNVYSELPGQARIDLCLRCMLWTGPPSESTALEVNFLETLLTLYIDLTAGFDVTYFGVENYSDEGRNEVIEKDKYELDGYRCDPNTLEPYYTNWVYQGEIVSICIVAEAGAVAEGLAVGWVEYFIWNRDYGAFNLTQVAVQNGIPSDDGLTEYDCTPGAPVCVFHTILNSAYFLTSGEVVGEGVATLAFAVPTRRRLEEAPKEEEEALAPPSRSLQRIQGASPVPSPEFGITLGVAAVDDRPPIFVATAGSGLCWASTSIVLAMATLTSCLLVIEI